MPIILKLSACNMEAALLDTESMEWEKKKMSLGG